MKWKNKGHELDAFAKPLLGRKKIYIYGAGKWGQYALEKMKFLDCVAGFIDGSKKKQEDGFCGLPVLPLEKIKELPKDFVIVIAASIGYGVNSFPTAASTIYKRLMFTGFRPREDFYFLEEFIDFYLPIYALYVHGKLVMRHLPISVTERCSLNCEKCNHSVPFIEKPQNFTVAEFCADIDLFFRHWDYVFYIVLVGGELFCHPQLSEIIDYIGNNYRGRILNFECVSNGTIPPSGEILRVMKKHNMHVIMSDYRDAVPRIKKQADEFIRCVQEAGVPFILSNADVWYDYAIGKAEIPFANEEEKIVHFDYCDNPCRYMRKGRLYFCTTDRMAQRAGLTPEDPYSYYDMNNISSDKRKELLEFEYGFSERGYPLLCTHCNGSIAVNCEPIPKAVQYKKDATRKGDQR